jgi:hypothetical protein
MSIGPILAHPGQLHRRSSGPILAYKCQHERLAGMTIDKNSPRSYCVPKALETTSILGHHMGATSHGHARDEASRRWISTNASEPRGHKEEWTCELLYT